MPEGDGGQFPVRIRQVLQDRHPRGEQGADDDAPENQGQHLVPAGHPGHTPRPEDGQQPEEEGDPLESGRSQPQHDRERGPETRPARCTQHVGGDERVPEQALVGGPRDAERAAHKQGRHHAWEADVPDHVRDLRVPGPLGAEQPGAQVVEQGRGIRVKTPQREHADHGGQVGRHQ